MSSNVSTPSVTFFRHLSISPVEAIKVRVMSVCQTVQNVNSREQPYLAIFFYLPLLLIVVVLFIYIELRIHRMDEGVNGVAIEVSDERLCL